MKRRRCTRCEVREAPPYHEWCAPCYQAWRKDRMAERYAADPALAEWRRVWNRLRMRAYRGHEMAEEACRTCGTRPAYLMLLSMKPLKWTWLCRADRLRQYPNRTVDGRPKRPHRVETRVAAEARSLGL